MLALTDKQRGFIDAMFEMGGNSPTKWARAAGYAEGDGLRVTAHRLWHDERISAAIDEEARRRFKGMVPAAIKTLAEVRDNPQASGAERTKAATEILARGGFHAVSEHKTTVEHLGDDPDQIKRITMLATALGLPLDKLLGPRMMQRIEAPLVEAEPLPANWNEDEGY